MKKFILFCLLFSSGFALAQKQWTLQECVNYALQNNLQVLQSGLTKSNQDLNLKAAKREYLPSVQGTVQTNTSFGQQLVGTQNVRNDNFNNNINVGANLLLFNHGRLEKQIRKTEFDVEASQFDTETTINDISLQIAQQYLSVLLNQEIVKISQSSLQNAQKLFDSAKFTTDVGTRENKIPADTATA